MGTTDKRADEATLWRSRRARLRLECRECEVICERVVYPWQCLRLHCEFVYSYEDGETMYFGCLYKVFMPELDLNAFCDDSSKFGGGKVKRSDPYGPIRVSRWPRADCPVRVEQAYDMGSGRSCCNPTFFHQPSAAVEDGMRLSTKRWGEGPLGENDPGGHDHGPQT